MLPKASEQSNYCGQAQTPRPTNIGLKDRTPFIIVIHNDRRQPRFYTCGLKDLGENPMRLYTKPLISHQEGKQPNLEEFFKLQSTAIQTGRQDRKMVCLLQTTLQELIVV